MKLNTDDFKNKIGDKWWYYLCSFFESNEAYDIYQTLKKDGKNEIITPSSKNTWKFLEKCSPDSVKVIIMGMD